MLEDFLSHRKQVISLQRSFTLSKKKKGVPWEDHTTCTCVQDIQLDVSALGKRGCSLKLTLAFYYSINSTVIKSWFYSQPGLVVLCGCFLLFHQGVHYRCI